MWEYLERVRRAQLAFEQALAMSDDALDCLLFPPVPGSNNKSRPLPDWSKMHRELGHKHVTLDLLWNEYRQQAPEGYGYSWFCKHYERWAASLPVTLRQTLTPGEKLFVDYSGKRLGIVNPDTGEIRDAELFVAALGVSGYFYAELTWTQQLPDWIASHVHAFAFYGGVPEIVVPDNLKSGVHKPDFFDPVINRTYGDMARHYGTAVIPARPRKPRDKPKAELSVLLAQRWILARLRHQRFFSLEEANRAIAALLVSTSRPPHHDPQSHARPPSGCNDRMESATVAALGEGHRSAHRGRHRTSARSSAASAANLSRCLGVLNMAKRHGRDRLEAACCRAIDMKAPTYQFIASTLKNGLERAGVEPSASQAERPLMHANVRGPSYYH